MKTNPSIQRLLKITTIAAFLFVSVSPVFAIRNGTLVSQTQFESDFPWAVLLFGPSSNVCTGQLVSPTTVLTAAHCVSNGLTLTQAVVGAADASNGTFINISSVLVHPDLDLQNFAFDAALVTLAQPVSLPPIQFATAQEIHNAAGTAELAGFGQTEFGVIDGKFRSGSISANALTADNLRIIVEFEIFGVSIAPGDSGGPLLITASDGTRVLAGTASFVSGTEFGIYTNLAAVLDFIEENVPDLPASDSEGPVVSNVSASPNPVSIVSTEPIAVAAIADDGSTGGSAIAAAQVTVQSDSGALLFSAPMQPVDSTFNAPFEQAALSFSPEIFSVAGLYDICVVAFDEHSNVSAPTCTSLAVFDPSTGFLTGGGHLSVAAGAFPADPTLGGPVNFAFVAKYHRSGEAPEGEFKLRFKDAGIEFSSEQLEFLIVDGEQAILSGTGQLNGSGEYQFAVWAEDGANGAAEDLLRIRIIDILTAEVVFDNGSAQQLHGGNIMVGRPGR